MVQSSQQTNESKPRGQLDAKVLKAAGKFTITFNNDRAIEVTELFDIDNWSLLVQAGGRKLLIPKHSIRYYVLPEVKREGQQS